MTEFDFVYHSAYTKGQGHRVQAPCGLRDCKNMALSATFTEVIKGRPTQGVDCSVSYSSSFVFLVYVVFCSLFLVVSTSAIDCLERLVSKMTYCVSSRTLNTAHSERIVPESIFEMIWMCYWLSGKLGK